MHELSIAQNIIEIVRQSLGTAPAQSVKKINLLVGKLTNILPDSLQFCFDALVQNTNLGNASLIIDHVPVEFICDACHSNTILDDWYFHCPSCGSPNVRVIRGNELQIQEIELQNELEEII